MLSNYDLTMLNLARNQSSYSKDRTKIGAVIVDNDILACGENSLPSEMNSEKLYSENKNKYIVHAETKAILKFPKLGRLGYDSCIYIWGLAPCSTCASLIVEKGIKRCIAVISNQTKNKELWEAEAEHSKTIFECCDVDYEFLTLEEFEKEVDNASKCRF